VASPARLAPAEAAALVRRRDTLAVPLGPGQPASFLHALGERNDFEDLRVFAALLVDLFPLFTRPGVHLTSGFFGPVERLLLQAGHNVHFVPADFRRFAPLLARLRPRVMATAVAPPDAAGRLSLSLHAGATVDELRRCGRDPERVLIAEVNPKLPRTLGLPPEHPHALSLDEVDVLVESRHDPRELPDEKPTPLHERIAEHALAFIPEGATLQTGIGGVPNALASLLARAPGGDYGIHSEMFTDGLMRLHEAGKVSNRKGLHDGFSAVTFAFGSAELYRWLDGREQVRFLPVHEINAPGIVARNRHMISINGALALDLFGQVAADTLGGRQHSGIGGHEDFCAGAGLAAGGRSLICLPSTAEAAGRRTSRILPRLSPDFLVTTPRHQLDVVVTEWGAADVAGLTTEERAEALLAIAHPDFREALREGWRAGTKRGAGERSSAG
jgi:acyl-CoA hydrolase